MKKAALILALIIIMAVFSLYILNPVFRQRWIGHQNDNNQYVEAGQPFAIASANATPNNNENSAVLNSIETTESQATIEVVEQTPLIPFEPKGWDLIWSDEFEKPQLNLEYWTEMERKNNYNKELQYYRPANSYIENGYLVLAANEEEIDGKEYSSGMVDSSGKLEMLYGRIEASISVPTDKGVLPSFWLTTNNDTFEMDIVEMVGKEPGTVYGVYHHKIKGSMKKKFGHTDIMNPEAFHLYALEWDKDEVRWYVDGEQYFSIQKNIPDEPLYILFTLAVGGEWPGRPPKNTDFPIYMKIDYVRIYCREKTEEEYHAVS